MTDKELKTFKEIDVILADLNSDDITSILKKVSEISEIKRQLDKLDEVLKIKVKTFLKERKWDRYFDKENKITVTLSQVKHESFDKEQLKLLLNENQYAQVVKISTFEKLMIITPEAKQRMKNYVMAKKN